MYIRLLSSNTICVVCLTPGDCRDDVDDLSLLDSGRQSRLLASDEDVQVATEGGSIAQPIAKSGHSLFEVIEQLRDGASRRSASKRRAGKERR